MIKPLSVSYQQMGSLPNRFETELGLIRTNRPSSVLRYCMLLNFVRVQVVFERSRKHSYSNCLIL